MVNFNLNTSIVFAEENGIEIIDNGSENTDKKEDDKKENNKGENDKKRKIPLTTALLLFVLVCGVIDVLFLNKSTNFSNLFRKRKE